jgi:hypothetical protein
MKYPESEIMDWLEWLRQCGREASFVQYLPEPNDPDMELVCKAIKAKSPKKPIGHSNVLLNQWFESLSDEREDLNSLVEQLLGSDQNTRLVKKSSKRSLIYPSDFKMRDFSGR